jgi:hypothetical protein
MERGGAAGEAHGWASLFDWGAENASHPPILSGEPCLIERHVLGCAHELPTNMDIIGSAWHFSFAIQHTKSKHQRAARHLSPTGALFLFHDVRLFDPGRRVAWPPLEEFGDASA